MEEKLPERLYKTPENWGRETFFLNEEQAEEAADDLTECFDEECCMADCTRLTFVQSVDEETAMYEGGWDGSSFDGRGYLIRREGDNYVGIEEFTTPGDYCYECQSQKIIAIASKRHGASWVVNRGRAVREPEVCRCISG